MTKNIDKYLNASSVKLEDWEKVANASLKDKNIKDLEKILDENIHTKPLYTIEDIKEDYSLSSRRGLTNNRNQYMPWYICSSIDHSNDSKVLNSRIINELERGSGSLELATFNKESLSSILNNVDLSLAPVYFKNLKNPMDRIEEYISYLDNWKSSKQEEPLGGYQIDPIAINLWLKEFSKEKFGKIIQHKDILRETLKIDSEVRGKFPMLEIIHFDGSLWNDVGAGLSKEIELIALSFLEVLKHSETNSINTQNIYVTISANTDFFALIAKIRSLRIIFSNIFKHFDVNGKLHITSRTSSGIIFKEDPWVNQLRITTAALASSIGGVERIVCDNITQKLGQAPDFIKRLTRNTHIILQEESRISRVQDPAGGSFFIEKLTNDITQNAWDNIKSAQKSGGIDSLLTSESFVNELRENRKKNKQDILDKKVKKIGVNIFEDPDSNPISVRPFEEVL